MATFQVGGAAKKKICQEKERKNQEIIGKVPKLTSIFTVQPKVKIDQNLPCQPASARPAVLDHIISDVHEPQPDPSNISVNVERQHDATTITVTTTVPIRKQDPQPGQPSCPSTFMPIIHFSSDPINWVKNDNALIEHLLRLGTPEKILHKALRHRVVYIRTTKVVSRQRNVSFLKICLF